jgi:hypothetical protein
VAVTIVLATGLARGGPRIGQNVRRPVLAVRVVGALGAAIAGALLVPGVIESIQWLPLVLSLVVFGVPHGAVDHLVPGRLLGRPLGNGPSPACSPPTWGSPVSAWWRGSCRRSSRWPSS